MSDKQVLSLFAAFALAGVLLLSYGIYKIINTSIFLSAAYSVEGRVIDKLYHDQSFSDPSGKLPRNRSEMVRVKVSFVSKEGKSIEFIEPSSTSSKYSSNIGDKVQVAHNPISGEARVVSFMTLWFVASVMTGMGLLAALIGIVMFMLITTGKLKPVERAVTRPPGRA